MVSVSLTSKKIMTQHGDIAFYVIYTLLGCEGTFLCLFDLSAKPHLLSQDGHVLSHPFSQVPAVGSHLDVVAGLEAGSAAPFSMETCPPV